ncbi:hypothetical protein [Candidatus Laterigemmans baculatus]|uniref:hypothetical protein n=1 Tax=Candidatus Laterigemmans baculatus TaxID=2770505 RepID=UPI0013DCC64D|nr:hypothetical protein [Candidatus Laterigemmans baculatus]
MEKMIRRHALRSIAGGGLAAALIGGSEATADSQLPRNSASGVLVSGTLTREHAAGRKMSGFIETGVREGITLCSLVKQDSKNPAIESIFAAPEQQSGRAGVRVTVAFFSDPVGDLTFSLLHMPAASESAPVRSV